MSANETPKLYHRYQRAPVIPLLRNLSIGEEDKTLVDYSQNN